MALIVIPRRVPWRRKPQIFAANPAFWDLYTHGFFTLNEGAGNPRDLIHDLVGTINGGATWAADSDMNQCVSFNGSTGFLQVTNSQLVATQPQFSVTVLFKSTATARGMMFAEAGDNTAAGRYAFLFIDINNTSAGDLHATLRNNDATAFTDVIHNGGYNDGNPHIATFLKYNNSSYELVVDGVSVDTDTTTVNNTDVTIHKTAIGALTRDTNILFYNGKIGYVIRSNVADKGKVLALHSAVYDLFAPRTQRIFIPTGGALSLSSAATLRDSDKPIATQQKAVSVDALIRAADLLIGSQQKSLSVDAILADADKLSTASRHEATLAAQLLDGDVSIASAQKAGSISGLLKDADKATGAASKAALVTGLLLDGDLLTALGSQIETHQSAGVLSGADVLIAGVTTNRTVSGKAQDGDALTVASAISRLSAALGIDPDTLTSASTSARSIGALIVEGDVALAGILTGRLQPALLIDGDILIITSSTVAQADLAGRINLSGQYAPQVSLVGVYAPAINLKGRVH